MTISDQHHNKAGDEKIRRLLADVLSREYTSLSYVGHEIFNLADKIGHIDLDELRAAQADTIRHELRRCELALGRLALAFDDLTVKLRNATDG